MCELDKKNCMYRNLHQQCHLNIIES
uniref:Uncharacterized protein n=1 Tax=Rhizophora mucronata TaxID=61149 RepID=A0A2P2Q825_RHIMU